MILLNFSHPTTAEQRTQIEALAGQPIAQLIEIMPQFDGQSTLADQVTRLVDDVELDSAAWQTAPVVVILPGLSPAAACLLAELHGRMGYFPPIVYVRPRPESALSIYEAAELLNLQALRERARAHR